MSIKIAGDNWKDNIAAIQEEAQKKIRKKQRKAQQKVRQNQIFNFYDNFSEKNSEINNTHNDLCKNNVSNCDVNKFTHKSKKEKNIDMRSEKNMFSSLIKNILPDMESDRIFLLFLILMLQGQECDNGLLLALFYIIM